MENANLDTFLKGDFMEITFDLKAKTLRNSVLLDE